MHQILSNGQFTDSSATETFHAYNPTLGIGLTEKFPVSPWEEIEKLIEQGREAAFELMKFSPDAIADFLESYASGIEAKAAELVEIAHEETGLAKTPRLADVEIPRTTNQLRLAAAAARDGGWRRPVRDAANKIYSVLGSLGGPVVVFGPNNFPFAFNGISGGDFAAAIAAGNPVIAKAHPAHPMTSKLLAEIALEALSKSDLPPATVQMFYQTESANGVKLVSHPKVGATGFTGSRDGGLALKKAADAVGKPIYLEMSSVNPVVMLPGALRERGQEIAAELQGSCAMGTGQFCTKPGVVFVQEGSEEEAFGEELYKLFTAAKPGVLLSHQGPANIAEAIEDLVDGGAKVLCGGGDTNGFAFSFQPTLLKASGEDFLANSAALQTEAFGNVALVVVAKDLSETLNCLAELEGNLTGSVYSSTDGSDDAAYEKIEPLLRTKVGRLLNDKMPTGVAVSPAMNHGGPFPATGHPGFTSVGIPASLSRFSALHCYDNVREARLPEILRS